MKKEVFFVIVNINGCNNLFRALKSIYSSKSLFPTIYETDTFVETVKSAIQVIASDVLNVILWEPLIKDTL